MYTCTFKVINCNIDNIKQYSIYQYKAIWKLIHQLLENTLTKMSKDIIVSFPIYNIS